MLAKGWDSDLRIHHMFFRFPPLLLATYDLRLENNAMRSALCFREMVQNRLEECLQALVARKDTGAVKRGKWLVNSVDTDPSLGRNQIREGWR